MIRLFSMAHILSLFFSVAGPLAGGPDTHTVLCWHSQQDRGGGWVSRGEKKKKSWLIMKVFQIAFLRRSGSLRGFRAFW